MFIGQQKVVAYFKTAIADGTLAHAYCFAGPSSVGKLTLARSLAMELLAATDSELDQHTDYILVERAVDEKTGKLKKEISIAQARGLRNRLQQRSWSGGYRVVIINEAELLNAESANALLKILEEPPERTVLFLISENEVSLLATIRSRVQVFYFPLVATDEIKKGLEQLGHTESEAHEAARMSWGRPGRAVALVNDPELRAAYTHERECWQKLQGASFFKQIALVEDLFGDPDDAIRGRKKVADSLELWELFCREALVAHFGTGGATPSRMMQATPGALVKSISALEEARTLLRQNVHPRLLVESVVLGF